MPIDGRVERWREDKLRAHRVRQGSEKSIALVVRGADGSLLYGPWYKPAIEYIRKEHEKSVQFANIQYGLALRPRQN